MLEYVTTRDLTSHRDENVKPADRHFSSDYHVIPAGTRLFAFTGATYGCISHDGFAVTAHGSSWDPFFEVPLDAIRPLLTLG